MSPSERPEYFKLFVEQIVSVPTIGNPVVHDQLLDHLDGSIAVKRQIFTITINYLALLLQPLLDAPATRALMTE